MSTQPHFSSRLLGFVDTCSWVALALFVTGGLTLRFATSRVETLELNQWGLFLLPLVGLYFGRPQQLTQLSFVRCYQSLLPTLASTRAAATIAIGLGVLHFFVVYSRYVGFHSDWDLTIYANACANSLHSSLRNNKSLLADHFEPALALIAPVCAITDPVLTVLASQMIAWTVGAWGVRCVAKQSDWSPEQATVAMVLYLLFSGHQTISYYDFHLYGWSLGTIPWLLYAVQANRLWLFTLLVILHLGLKEHTSLFIAGFGAWLFLRKQRSLGLVTTAVGLVAFIAIMKWIFPYFRDGQDSEYFAKYYGYLGASSTEFLINLVRRPWLPMSELLSVPKLLYFAKLFVPFALVIFLRPTFLLPIAGVLMVNALSTAPYLFSTDFHYDAEVYPWLFVSTLVLTRDPIVLRRWYRVKYLKKTSPGLLWLAILAVFFTGSTPLGRMHYYMPTHEQVALHGQLRNIAKDNGLARCSFMAAERIAPHLAAIPQLTMLDVKSSSDAVVIAYPIGDHFWMRNVAEIEEQIVPDLNRNYQLHQPANYDRDLRIWTKPNCLWPF